MKKEIVKSFQKLSFAAGFIIPMVANSTTLVIAMDNSSSTMENRQSIAKQCSTQFVESMSDRKISKIHYMTIGSAKNASISESKKIGPRDNGEFMTRETAISHFKRYISDFPKNLESGKIRLDDSSAIYYGILNDASSLFKLPSGAPAESGVLIVCSDFIENEVVKDVVNENLPTPKYSSLRNIQVFGIGIGLGLDSIEQNKVRENWIRVMRQAGADFIPLKVK